MSDTQDLEQALQKAFVKADQPEFPLAKRLKVYLGGVAEALAGARSDIRETYLGFGSTLLASKGSAVGFCRFRQPSSSGKMDW